MRIRTMMTFSTGAALGAGAMYVLDPEHGPQRRRDARRHALRQARQGAVHALVDVRRRAEELALAAVGGFERGRTASRLGRASEELYVVGDGRIAG